MSGGSGKTADGAPSDRALGRLTGWYAVALRLGSAVIYAVVGPLAAAGGVSAWWLRAVLVTLGVWSALFAWLVRRAGLAGPVALADAVVIAVLLPAQRYVVPAALIADGTTWMLPLASTSVFILQLALRPALSLPAAGAVTAVYVGTVAHPAGAWILILQAVVTAALMTLLRNAGRSADAAIGAALRGEQDMRAEAARRADEREQHRQLHDTILSTLTMIASGAFHGRSGVLCSQAGRDLDVLRRLQAVPEDAPVGPADLCARIGTLATAAPVTVRLIPAPVSLPGTVTEHIAGSVAEALRNVALHAGVDQADVTIRGGDGWVTVEVTDQGTGFDTRIGAAVAAGSQGIDRRPDVRRGRSGCSDQPAGHRDNGRAAVARVTAVRPLAVLSARYRRALNIAVVIVVAGWQVAGAGSELVADRADYRSVTVQVAIWLVLAAVIVAGSVRLLRGMSGWPGAWALAMLALLAGTAAAAACPADQMLKTDWAWGAVGWVGVLVLLRRPFGELAGFLSLTAVATFAILARDGLHRAGLAGFITILAGSAGIQFAVTVAAGALEMVARPSRRGGRRARRRPASGP